jgi:hypothetical protein
MSPAEIDILLHYYVSPVDHPRIEAGNAFWRSTVAKFRAESLLELMPPGGGPACYRLADRGQVYVAALLSLPLPVPYWEMPAHEPLRVAARFPVAGEAPSSPSDSTVNDAEIK